MYNLLPIKNKVKNLVLKLEHKESIDKIFNKLTNLNAIPISISEQLDLTPTIINSINIPFKDNTEILNLFEIYNKYKSETYNNNNIFISSGMVDNYSILNDGNIIEKVYINANKYIIQYNEDFKLDVYTYNKLRFSDEINLNKLDKIEIINNIYSLVLKFIDSNGFEMVDVMFNLSNLFTRREAIIIKCKYLTFEFKFDVITYLPEYPTYYTLVLYDIRKQIKTKKIAYFFSGSSCNRYIIYTTFINLINVNPLILKYFKIFLNHPSIDEYHKIYVSPHNLLIEQLLLNSGDRILEKTKQSQFDFIPLSKFIVKFNEGKIRVKPYLNYFEEWCIRFSHNKNELLSDEESQHTCLFDELTFVDNYNTYKKYASGDYIYSNIFRFFGSEDDERFLNLDFDMDKSSLFTNDIIKLSKTIIQGSKTNLDNQNNNYILKMNIFLSYNPDINSNIILTINSYYIKKADAYLYSITSNLNLKTKYQFFETKIEGTYTELNMVLAYLDNLIIY